MRAALNLRMFFLALVAALALALPAAAQTFPALTGRVVDEAGILDPSTRATLISKLAAVETQTGDQIAVATVKSLEGRSVEDYANRLFRAWRLGHAAKNNGVLLLVAPAERKVRIEVGYGLEGTLTDAVAKLIIEQSIVPRFRAGDFAGGIVRATDDILQVLTGDALAWQRRAAVSPPQAQPAAAVGSTELPGWAEKLLIAFFLLVFAIVAGLFGLLFLVVLAAFLVWLGVLPKQKDRHGAWLWLDYLNRDPAPDRRPLRAHSRSSRSSDSSWSSPSSSDSSSSSSDSFSGGGGSSGGGGASGSW
jgi:uncharacterized protein